MSSFAIISDIHGNSWALQKVLSDIRSRGITSIINLGDTLYGPLDPMGTFRLLREYGVYSISGNQDRLITENLSVPTDIPTLEYVKREINGDVRDWLQNLPFDYSPVNDVYCCHATPQCDSTYLLENIEDGHISIKAAAELDEELKGIVQKYVFCGHSHIPRLVETRHKTIVNPGSVGLPAYDDDFPIPHKMETFSPRARYSLINIENEELVINSLAVNYPYELATETALANNRGDWAEWIRTGRV